MSTWMIWFASFLVAGLNAGCIPNASPLDIPELNDSVQDFDNQSLAVDVSRELPDPKLCREEPHGWSCVLTTEGIEENPFDQKEKLKYLNERFKASCEDAGGRYVCYGWCMATYRRNCDFPLADRGKACTTSVECAGTCLAPDDWRPSGHGPADCSGCVGICSTHITHPCERFFELNGSKVLPHIVLCD